MEKSKLKSDKNSIFINMFHSQVLNLERLIVILSIALCANISMSKTSKVFVFCKINGFRTKFPMKWQTSRTIIIVMSSHQPNMRVLHLLGVCRFMINVTKSTFNI